VLSYQLLVVLVALVGGIWPALFAAVLSGFTLDYFFIDPLYTITVDEPLHMLALILYVVIALLVSWIVDQAARRTRLARRAAAEAELLATVSGSVLRGEGAVHALVSRAREAFGLQGVKLVDRGETIAWDGVVTGASATDVAVGSRGVLTLYGDDLEASGRRLLRVIAAQLDAALEHRDLSDTAREVGPLAQTDRVRTALLSAVAGRG
jgi:two-component system sensor histidine kinase KdpD